MTVTRLVFGRTIESRKHRFLGGERDDELQISLVTPNRSRRCLGRSKKRPDFA